MIIESSKHTPLREVDKEERGEQNLYRFDNGFGASVVRGPYYYSSPEGPFELAVLKWEDDNYGITYDTEITSDVIGYLDAAEVEATLDRIAALPADQAVKP